MSNCINFRTRTETKDKKKTVYFYCTKNRKKIQFSDCKNCKYKEYKQYKKMKQRTSKQAKLERDRFSLFTDDLTKCYLCNNKKNHIHEIFFGRNRLNSIKYNLTLPLCTFHHRLMHSETSLIDEYHKKGQAMFNKTYPDLDFEKIFKINYL